MPKYQLQSSSVKLAVKVGKSRTHITMTVSSEHLNTAQFPNAKNVLDMMQPSVFQTECFNPGNLPFNQEVVETETAHLLEHLALDVLHTHINSNTPKECEHCVDGVTRWNWEKEPVGTYHIFLTVGQNEQNFLQSALQNSLGVLEAVFATKSYSER